MSLLTSSDKTKLNNFHKSQPALVNAGKPFGSDEAGVMLGDLMALAVSTSCVKATWDFSVKGGAITPDIELDAVLPAGAIVTGVITREVTNVTSAGVCLFNLKAGATSLCSIANATAMAGVEAQTVSLSYLSADSKVYLNIDTTAATAGKVEFYIQFICP
jgi:hypothetical protein